MTKKLADRIKTLKDLGDSFYQRLKSCDLCPRQCRVDRLSGKVGFCGMAEEMKVYTAFLHQGEEPPISGTNGSGTIFFSGCTLRCEFCQNFKFSHQCQGSVVSSQDLALLMLLLEKKGAHNINLVTPTHFLPQIIRSLEIAFQKGLCLPVVYNTSGYETHDVVTLLSDVVDIYLPDIKYINSETAQHYSAAADYVSYNQKILPLMNRQKPYLWNNGLLTQGTIIRHLVLPGHIDESVAALEWLKQSLPEVLVSVMFQYQPYYKAAEHPEINRRVTRDEYEKIVQCVETLQVKGWIQDLNPQEELAGVHFDDDVKNFLLERDRYL